MMQAAEQYIGVDVSKAELVIAQAGGQLCRVSNDVAGISGWLEQVSQPALIAMESTGRYHGLLAQLAHEAGVTVYVLNARDVYFYAKTLGSRAKTDGVDATVIARYLVEHHARLRPWRPGSALQQRLQGLLARRAQLTGHRTALRQALAGGELQGIDVQPLHSSFAQVIEAIDATVQALIDGDAELGQGCARLRTIIGFGPQAAALLTVLLSRLQLASADALVAYCGLDPRPNDSGARRGRRRLTKKGPPLLRRQIYLVGCAAAGSKALKPLYQSIRAQGFATTEAALILGRKLLRAAFAIWKNSKPFDPARLLPPKSA